MTQSIGDTIRDIVAEAQRDELAQRLEQVQNQRDLYERERDELAAQLATVTAERDAMRKDMARILPTLEEELGYLGSCDHDVNICSCDFRAAVETVAKHAGKQTAEQSAFERTAPVDWRDVYQGETPLGIALDDSGDVEP